VRKISVQASGVTEDTKRQNAFARSKLTALIMVLLVVMFVQEGARMSNAQHAGFHCLIEQGARKDQARDEGTRRVVLDERQSAIFSN
jgi:hypothetical protein